MLAIESHGRGLLGRGRARSERELRLELESDATDFASMMANVRRAKEDLARARLQAAATWVQSHVRGNLGRTRAGTLASEREDLRVEEAGFGALIAAVRAANEKKLQERKGLAATRLQCVFRGRADRLTFYALRAKRAAEEEAERPRRRRLRRRWLKCARRMRARGGRRARRGSSAGTRVAGSGGGGSAASVLRGRRWNWR